MADDKYIGLVDVTKSLQDLTKVIERRNVMLEMMFKDDLRSDFLAEEESQTSEDVDDEEDAVDSVKPGGVSLWNLIPLAMSAITGGGSENNSDDGSTPTQKFAKGGVVGTTPIIPGAVPQQTPNAPGSSTSLEKSGFDDTFLNNISTKLEDDFDLDPLLKKGFGDALGLPARAAAAALLDLMSKIPAQTPEQKEILRENIREISSAYRLNKASIVTKMEENVNEQSIFDKIGNFFRGIPSALGLTPPPPPNPTVTNLPSSPTSAGLTPQHQGPVIPSATPPQATPPSTPAATPPAAPAATPPAAPVGSKGYGRDPGNVSDAGPHKATKMPLEPLAGAATGFATGGIPGAVAGGFGSMVNNIKQSFLQSIGIDQSTASVMGAGTSAALSPSSDPGAAPATNLSELTEKTIAENRAFQQEKVELATAKLQVTTEPPMMGSTTSSSPLNSMEASMASEDTSRSPYFLEYADSSTYG